MTQIINMVRNFLFSSANREFLTFFFFLVLSTIFWLMTALNETYEREVSVPAYLVNVPKNVVITSDMEDTVRVTVRDKGFALLAYIYGEGVRPININFQSFVTRQSGYGVVPSQELMKMVNQRFSGASKVVQVKPDRLDFYYNYGQSRHRLRQQADARLAALREDRAHQHHQLQRHGCKDRGIGEDKGR